MRVLILSALLACAAAAPSGVPLFAHQVYSLVPAVPSIPIEDVQAAAIDAQVKAEDQARAFADQARERAEQAAENPLEGVAEANDIAKEKNEEGIWNAEEQKWKALDALKTAEAEADAAFASRSPSIARSYIPYVASGAVVSGIPALIPAYQQAVIAKVAEAPAAAAAAAAGAAAPAPAAFEAPKTEDKEAAVKTAELEKTAELAKTAETMKTAEPMMPAEAEKATDSVQVESADLKASAPEPAKNENPFVIQSFSQTHPLYASPLAIAPLAPALYSQPWVAPVGYVQPGLRALASSTIHQVHGQYIHPAVLKSQW